MPLILARKKWSKLAVNATPLSENVTLDRVVSIITTVLKTKLDMFVLQHVTWVFCNFLFQSFVTIAKKFSKFTIFRFTATKSLFIFSPWNPFRKFCIRVISNQYFDLIILLSILINCIMMIVKEPTDERVILAFEILEWVTILTYIPALMNLLRMDNLRWVSYEDTFPGTLSQ